MFLHHALLVIWAPTQIQMKKWKCTIYYTYRNKHVCVWKMSEREREMWESSARFTKISFAEDIFFLLLWQCLFFSLRSDCIGLT